MNFPHLFSPLEVGPYRLQHRVAMAPLTRMRADRSSFAPRGLNAEYYGQRATPGGLLIAEASPVMVPAAAIPARPVSIRRSRSQAGAVWSMPCTPRAA